MPVTHRYVPANTKADLPPGSPYLAMDAFLLSDRVQDVASAAAGDIATAAGGLAHAEGLVDTGQYAEGFHDQVTAPVGGGGELTLEGGPRRAAAVVNDVPHAAGHEFGNGLVAAKHILFRAGEPWDTPRRPR